MNELTIIDRSGVEVVDSREVAEAIGKQHAHLMRDIKNYCDILDKSSESKIGLADFFIPSTYIDSQDKERPCYLLTKKGCDMVANKMTGEKGVIFTAMYVSAFEKMRERITKPMTAAEMFQLQAQINVEQERRLAAIEAHQQKVIEACSVPAVGRDEWQENMKKYLSGLCEEYSMSYPVMYDDLYSALERKVGCDLDRRQSNMRKRLKDAGATYKERQSVSKLTVIAKDPSLTGVFEGIVQRYAAHLASRKWEGRN
nr:MAG TPA: regulatory protein [Caudoviricetes sp.]